MKTCVKCVLNERYPGVVFDSEGVCNYCRASKSPVRSENEREQYRARFEALLREGRGKGPYDCLVAYSGGKDSTYALYLAKEVYGLKVLCYSLNNWYQSEAAFKNIATVVQSLGVDHISFAPSKESMRKLFKASAREEIYTKKALERASSICTTCISIVRYYGYKTAIEKQIPFVITGMSPGQAPLKTSIVPMTLSLLRTMQNATLTTLGRVCGDEAGRFFIEERHLQGQVGALYSVNLLAFTRYDEDEIHEIIRKLGWVRPEDTDPNSSNCLLNAYANHLHEVRYGFNPYSFEVANMVRDGILGREEGLRRLLQPPAQELIENIEKDFAR